MLALAGWLIYAGPTATDAHVLEGWATVGSAGTLVDRSHVRLNGGSLEFAFHCIGIGPLNFWCSRDTGHITARYNIVPSGYLYNPTTHFRGYSLTATIRDAGPTERVTLRVMQVDYAGGNPEPVETEIASIDSDSHPQGPGYTPMGTVSIPALDFLRHAYYVEAKLWNSDSGTRGPGLAAIAILGRAEL